MAANPPQPLSESADGAGRRFPSHVVCAWIGNTQVAFRRPYLRVTDEHSEAASRYLRRYPKVEEASVAEENSTSAESVATRYSAER